MSSVIGDEGHKEVEQVKEKEIIEMCKTSKFLWVLVLLCEAGVIFAYGI